MHDILSDADKLQVRWGNQEILPYEGYVELEVSLDNDTPANVILVPFLITPERLHYPILGTNAIEHMSQNYQSNELADVMNECLPDKSKNIIESLVNFIQRNPKNYQMSRHQNIMSLYQQENKSLLNVTWIE